MSTPLPVVYVLHGMKRAGNHALVNWLLPQLRCDFVNNALPLGAILRGAGLPGLLPFVEWRASAGMGDPAGKPLLVTLEDHALDTLPFHPEGIELRRLLLVRRPLQLFSSRIRKASRVEMPAYPRDNDAVMQRAAAICKQHARCFLGEDAATFPGRVAISFDAWHADRDYRRALSAALGIAFDDAGFGRVSDVGGGSSFDGTGFDGRGQMMRVDDRVSGLDPRERALLEAIFADPELRELDERIACADPYARLSSA